MRYYHYISDAKAEMLFAQIPPSFLSGLKVELGFDFGVLKGKLAGEREAPATRVARAEAVERFLEKEASIEGSPIEHTWLRGKFPARIGFLTDCPGLVLFGGKYQDCTLILAGSESHRLSGSANAGKDKGWSFMPRLLMGLRDYLDQNYDTLDLRTDNRLRPSEVANDYIFGGPVGSGGSMREALLTLPEDSLPEPEIAVTFLCRVFYVVENNLSEKLVLASPLYVAQ